VKEKNDFISSAVRLRDVILECRLLSVGVSGSQSTTNISPDHRFVIDAIIR